MWHNLSRVTPERYRQVNALADAALQMTAGRRATFLNEVCGSDRELRQQIEALIAAESGAPAYLEKPLLEELAGDMLARPERELAGRRIENYEVLSRLGSGGIGEVWLARDLTLHREVALKLLSPRFASSPYHTRRFQQEARAASALNHPNIITVYEIGVAEGALFIAEERVEGETVRQRMIREPMPLAEILNIGAQAAAALGAAHAAGIVHRDIKPENVMLRPDGLVKVVDFGLARYVEPVTDDGSPGTWSNPGFVLGTVRYMSPEQARGLAVDGRSDQFSLGVMLYEMAAGAPPFLGATSADTLAAILQADPPPLSPAAFDRVVRRCLAKDPDARYGSAEELRVDLLALAAPPPVARKPWGLVTAACAAVALLAAIVLFANRTRPASPFEQMRITRLVTRGDVTDVAISPDGSALAYVVPEKAGESIWIRKTASQQENLAVSAEAGEHSGLTFSPDSASLYYRRRGAEGSGDLYRVSMKGGAPVRVSASVSGAASVSPDGRRIAFVRLDPATWQSSVMVAKADGSGESSLRTLQRPRSFDNHQLAWSPDGASLAVFEVESARYSEMSFHLVEIRVADGSQRAITAQTWQWPRSVVWPAKAGFLLVTAATRADDGYQVSKVRYANGAVTRVTNDLSNYDRVTVTSDGKQFATVQSETSASVWVAQGGEAARAVRVSAAPIRAARMAVAWTLGGQLIYSNATGDYRNLWKMDGDGKNPRRLTSGEGNKDQIALTRDGRYIVYKQYGNIWRMDTDGTHPFQLTHGPLDVHPDVAADGGSVVYASFANWSPAVGGEPTLWRVPIGGGEAQEIAAEPASYPRISPDGALLGCIYFPGKDPRISAAHVALLRLDGTGGFMVLAAAPSDETEFAWSPDGKALDYVVNAGGVGNIWRQPATGGIPRQVTRFQTDEIYAFAWSRDGRLAAMRGTATRGAVLIEN